MKVLHIAASDTQAWGRLVGLEQKEEEEQQQQQQPRLIDLLLIDHEKAAYLKDLQAIERRGYLRSGSVVVADNVLSFGSPLHVRKIHNIYTIHTIPYHNIT